MPVTDPRNRGNEQFFQEILASHRLVNQVLGPVVNVNLWPGAKEPSEKLKEEHKSHIHVGVKP